MTDRALLLELNRLRWADQQMRALARTLRADAGESSTEGLGLGWRTAAEQIEDVLDAANPPQADPFELALHGAEALAAALRELKFAWQEVTRADA